MALKSSVENQRYRQALFRAEFYRWCVQRGHSINGNDPVSGMPRNHWNNREESRAVYMAQAKYWIGRAKAIRGAA